MYYVTISIMPRKYIDVKQFLPFFCKTFLLHFSAGYVIL